MAETRYYRIAPKFWRHAVARQWTDPVGYLALYVLTTPHRNIAGLYYLPLPYIMADMGWDREKTARNLEVLCHEDFVRYDAQSHVIFLVNALAYDAPENANQRKGAIKALAEVPYSPLWRDLLTQAQQHSQQFADAVRELLSQRFPKLLPEPFDKPLPEPIGEQNGNSVAVAVTVPVTVAVADADPMDVLEEAEQFVLPIVGKTQLTGDEWVALREALAAVDYDLDRFRQVVRDKASEVQSQRKTIHSFAYFRGRFADIAAGTDPGPPKDAAPRYQTLDEAERKGRLAH